MRSFSGVQLNFSRSCQSRAMLGVGGGTYGWGVAGFAAGLLLGRHGGLVLGVVVVVVVEFECGFVLCGCVVIVGEEGTKVGDDRQIREKVGKILLEGRRIQDYVT